MRLADKSERVLDVPLARPNHLKLIAQTGREPRAVVILTLCGLSIATAGCVQGYLGCKNMGALDNKIQLAVNGEALKRDDPSIVLFQGVPNHLEIRATALDEQRTRRASQETKDCHLLSWYLFLASANLTIPPC